MTAAARPPKVHDPYADGRLIYGEPASPAAGSFTLAVLPDTQFYSDMFPDQYLAQTRWIVERQAERNVPQEAGLGLTPRCSGPRPSIVVPGLLVAVGHGQ